MAASVRQAQCYAQDASHSTIDAIFPLAPAAGNLLLVAFSTFGAQPTTPSGWTLVFWENAGGDSMGLYSKTAGGSEPTNQFTLATGSNNCALTVVECHKVTGLVDATHTTSLAGAGPFVTPTNAVTTDAFMVQILHIRDTAPSVVAASCGTGWTQDSSAADSSSSRTACVGHKAVVGAQTVAPNFTVPDSSYDRGAGITIELGPVVDIQFDADYPAPRFAGPAMDGLPDVQFSVDYPAPRFAGPVMIGTFTNPAFTTEAHFGLVYNESTAATRTTEASMSALYTVPAPIRTTDAYLAILWADPQPEPPKPNWKRRPTSAMRPVNMYGEKTPKGPSQVTQFQRPALAYHRRIGDGPIRKLFSHRIPETAGGQLNVNAFYEVSGDKLYREGSVFAGNLPNPLGPVRVAQDPDNIVLVSGGNAYLVDQGTLLPLSIPDDQSVVDVVNVGERFVFQIFNSDRFYWSDIGDPTVIDGLSFATGEADPDYTVCLGVVGQDLALVGAHTVEFWSPNGDPDAPFLRSGGRTYDKGCAAIETVINADNTLWMLGEDRVFYRFGSVPQRVSNNEVEDELRLIPDENLVFAECGTLVFNGHTFITLTLPGPAYGRGSEFGTWVYDVQTQDWRKWTSWNRDRFRGRVFHEGFAGDAFSGTVFRLDGEQCYDSDGTESGFDPIERVYTKFLPLDHSPLRLNSVGLYCDMGVGQISGWGSEPKVQMRFSFTEGKDWTDWVEADIGSIGEYQQMGAVWYGLGLVYGPGIYFEFKVSDPVMFTVYDVKINQQRY